MTINKALVLDLLAIHIHHMQQMFDRISQEPEQWPDAPSGDATAQAPQAPQAPQVETAPAAETAPPALAINEHPETFTQTQTLLREISLQHGTDWITGTLFPQFNITNLNDLPAHLLEPLKATAEAYKTEKAK